MTSTAKTVRVRILVAVDEHGSWVSSGFHLVHRKVQQPDPREWIAVESLDDRIVYRWVEADVPMPMATVVVGGVVTDAGDAA